MKISPLLIGAVVLGVCGIERATIRADGEQLGLVSGCELRPEATLADPSLAAQKWPHLAQFQNRNVPADPSQPLPDNGETFYLLTRRPLSREAIVALYDAKLHFLGVVGQRRYAFRRLSGEANVQRAALLAHCTPLGTALALPCDRMTADVYAWAERDQDADVNTPLPFPLRVAFWTHTPASEVRRLLGSNLGGLELSQDEHDPLGPVCMTTIEVTVGRLKELAASPCVSSLDFAKPVALNNAESRTLMKVDQVATTPGLDGAGVTICQFDGGRIDAHPDLSGKYTNITTAAVNDHATHVCGTMCGSGAGNAAAKGIAPGAHVYVNDIDAQTQMDDRVTARHAYYHEVDNHSWSEPVGASQYGNYGTNAWRFDVQGRDLLLMGCKGAGNNGPSFDSLGHDSTGRNCFVVGAVNGTATGMWGGSSRGPTDDGRIKPDFVCKGMGVVSTWIGGGYYTWQGTSMATPNMTGVCALLAQHHKQKYNGLRLASDFAKTVFVQTAVDIGAAGPSYQTGWGPPDIQAAAALVDADVLSGGKRIVRGSVRDGETAEWKMSVLGGASQVKVTLSWLDMYQSSTPTSYSPTNPVLLHDLDLELVEPNGTTVHYPWILDWSNPSNSAITGANHNDNVEQVVVSASPVAGDWTVRVRGTNVSDPSFPVQGFVLATSYNLDRSLERLVDAAANGAGRALADSATVSIPFVATIGGTVSKVRVFLDVLHTARGNLEVTLQAPDASPAVIIETSDASMVDDLFAIYPDTRSQSTDLSSFLGKAAIGTWTLTVRDTALGNTGTIRAAALEIETDTGGGSPAPVLTTITVTPDPVTLAPGGIQQFTATGYDQFGAVMTISPSPTWSVSAGGGSISASGLLTASAANGAYTVTAASGAVQDTANVTISSIPVLSTITVSPSPATIAANGTRQFTAVARDQFGNVIAFSPAWIATGGTIDASGFYSAGATTGSFSVTATDPITAVLGTATVTVTVTSGGGDTSQLGGGGCALEPGEMPKYGGVLCLAMLSVLALVMRLTRVVRRAK